MNLIRFMQAVDASCRQMSEEQLRAFIHNLARSVPEPQRDYFLSKLPTVEKAADPEEDAIDLKADVKKSISVLEKITEGDRCLNEEYSEGYGDYYDDYDDDGGRIEYDDPDGILVDINHAVSLMHSCVDQEHYQEGYDLAFALSGIIVPVDAEYSSETSMTMDRLASYNLIDASMAAIATEALLLAYMAADPSERAEKMYSLLTNFDYYNVTLEGVMQLADQDLPEFDAFLKDWIKCLASKKDSRMNKLLQEALAMEEDQDFIHSAAYSFSKTHPELYLYLMQDENAEDEERIAIGKEALKKIPAAYTIRAQIALLTADCSCHLNDNEEKEKCWLEAFRSDTTAVNYMRIRFFSEDWKKYEQEIEHILQSVRQGERDLIYNYEIKESYRIGNVISKKDLCTILFFQRNYAKMKEIGMSTTHSLGWSSTFMKEGIALLLLTMYRGRQLPIGLFTMLYMACDGCSFSTEEILKGTGQTSEVENADLFQKLFMQWKQERDDGKLMYEEHAQWIEKRLSKRVSGIMSNDRRNYYDECAAFVAAYGEVQESYGIQNGKQDFMMRYKEAYPRRRNFIEALRSYGMSK